MDRAFIFLNLIFTQATQIYLSLLFPQRICCISMVYTCQFPQRVSPSLPLLWHISLEKFNIFFVCLCVWFFETRSRCIIQLALNSQTSFYLVPECWDYSHVPPHLVSQGEYVYTQTYQPLLISFSFLMKAFINSRFQKYLVRYSNTYITILVRLRQKSWFFSKWIVLTKFSSFFSFLPPSFPLSSLPPSFFFFKMRSCCVAQASLELLNLSNPHPHAQPYRQLCLLPCPTMPVCPKQFLNLSHLSIAERFKDNLQQA